MDDQQHLTTRKRHRRAASHRRSAGVVAISLALLVAGCGGDDGSASSSDGAANAGDETMTAKVAFSTGTIPSLLGRTYGPLVLGEKFGLKQTKDDFTAFEDSAVATQSMLSGKIDAIESSFLSLYVIRERGQDIKAFCPTLLTGTYALVGNDKVNSLTDLQRDDVKVGVDSPGGSVDAALAAMFKADTGKVVTGRELPNTETVTSSSERVTALAAGKIDAAMINTYQVTGLQEQAPDMKIVASYPEKAPLTLDHAYQASGEWLDSHQETATAICAAYIMANQQMAADYDLFKKVVSDETYNDTPIALEKDIKDLWDMLNALPLWPLVGKGGEGFEPERLQFMADLGRDMGLLKKDVDIEAAVDRRPLEGAIKLVEEQTGTAGG
jgi:ABC-type nitrate/sulfonate/bicarbonate transport system substrate-binding protein